MSGSRFVAGMHALGSLKPNGNSFDDFNFSTKIMIFRKFLKSLKIHDFCSFRLPRVDVRQLSRGVREAREIRKSDAGRRRRRLRGQKLVRNVSSDVPVTFYGDRRRIIGIFEKSPKHTIC